MPIKQIIASLRRKQTRKKTIRAIHSSVQKNEGVVTIHRIDKNNIGDYFCAPHHYFDTLKNTQLDIFDFKREDPTVTKNFIKKISENALIIGGGGLLNRKGFHLQMQLFQQLAQQDKKTVLWGVGHNEKSSKSFGKVTQYNIDISSFGLVGTRDYSMPGEYVPCVSCLHSVFDKPITEIAEVGIIFHKDTMKNKVITQKFSHIPSTSNTTNLEELIQFIGEHQNIITNSYHAMYWSMLLNKRVSVIPNSSKFFDFKYQPLFTHFEDCLSQYKKAEKYSGVKEECREINLKFYDKVANYLNL